MSIAIANDPHESTWLLRAVANIIRTDPKGYEQRDWVDLANPLSWGRLPPKAREADIGTPLGLLAFHEAAQEVDCGTTACIAGHLVIHVGRERILALPENVRNDMAVTGAELFGLKWNDAYALFMSLSGKDHVRIADLLDSLADIHAEDRAVTREAEGLILDALEAGV